MHKNVVGDMQATDHDCRLWLQSIALGKAAYLQTLCYAERAVTHLICVPPTVSDRPVQLNQHLQW